MQKKTHSSLDKLREKFYALTAKDSSMNAEYFKSSYGIDLNDMPDDIETKYWNKCLKDMQGLSTKVNEMPCSEQKRAHLSSIKLIKHKCSDGSTITTQDIADNFKCAQNTAAHIVRKVEKICGCIDRSFLEDKEKYDNLLKINKKNTLKKYIDIDSKKEYDIRDLRAIFPKYTYSVLKKACCFLESKSVFSVEFIRTKLENKRGKK